MSRLRARCPDCRTLTAVAIGPEYQCHSCGREFAAGLVRVPRAWGDGGEAMVEAAWLELPYPETGVVEASSLAEQTLMVAAELPDRPLVLGGCCCAHMGAIERLASGEEPLAVVWIDAHGDLNTPAGSPSGNAWGMPLRLLLDDGAIEPANVALVGARNLDPAEVEFIATSGLHTGDGAVERALGGTGAVYVALDGDSVEPDELAVFMPEPNGFRLAELEELLRSIAVSSTVAGAGLSGLVGDPANVPKLTRLCAALHL
ncbi:MAG: arginase family protein [Gaiellaceae bacterium MAG52_C11]|nr:arginase family protein [Candidatus Gaiellasilicea maunaloa]